MRVALYRSVAGRYDFVNELSEYYEDPTKSGSIRLSEIVDVDFVPLSHGVQVAQEIRAIDQMHDAVTAEFTQKLHALAQRKSELLALSFEVPA